MDNINRLTKLLMYMHNSKIGASAAYMAERLKVSKKQVTDDIDVIKKNKILGSYINEQEIYGEIYYHFNTSMLNVHNDSFLLEIDEELYEDIESYPFRRIVGDNDERVKNIKNAINKGAGIRLYKNRENTKNLQTMIPALVKDGFVFGCDDEEEEIYLTVVELNSYEEVVPVTKGALGKKRIYSSQATERINSIWTKCADDLENINEEEVCEVKVKLYDEFNCINRVKSQIEGRAYAKVEKINQDGEYMYTDKVLGKDGFMKWINSLEVSAVLLEPKEWGLEIYKALV